KTDLLLLVSTDGGRSFSSTANAHGDFHTVWIDPSNTNVLFTGDDGGFWSSIDGGTRWIHAVNLPVSQFYHVSVDNANPYHVFGGFRTTAPGWEIPLIRAASATHAGRTLAVATASGPSPIHPTRLT